MIKRILTCSDGSGPATAAAGAAASIAARSCGEVIVLNVYDIREADRSNIGAWAIEAVDDAIGVCANAQRNAIEAAMTPIFSGQDIPHRIIQEVGCESEVSAILRVAQREHPDLIVVGSRGLRGIQEVLLGSVSSSVVHHANCPVLVARGGDSYRGTTAFDRILLASDGSPCAQRAAQVAVELARLFGVPLAVLNVYEELSSETIPGDEDRLIDAKDAQTYAKQWLDYVAEPVNELAKDAGVSCSFVQQGGNPADSIAEYAVRHEVDLIVVGSRGLGGYARLMMGSVSDRVVHHAPCSVLIVR